jgi:hypothetical protein
VFPVRYSSASHKRRQKRDPIARGYNWATLFHEDIDTVGGVSDEK